MNETNMGCHNSKYEEHSKPGYLKFRCCMCPNINHPERTLCPSGPFKPEITSCRFVKTYIDERGWKYRVMPGLGEHNFKARYQKPDKTGSIGWKCIKSLPWRNTFDEAQSDLNMYAEKKGWSEL